MSTNGTTAAPAVALLALQRWLVQLRDPENPAYTYIRRIELGFDAIRDDNKKVLRGARVANNLVITRQLEFFRLIGRRKARALSIEDVASQYSLETIQDHYRRAMDSWKRRQKVS